MTQCMLNYTQIKLLPLLNEDYVFASVYLYDRLYACEQPQFKNFVFSQNLHQLFLITQGKTY